MTKTQKLFPALSLFLFTAIQVFLISGCGTLKPGDIPEKSQWEDLSPLRLEMQADIIQLRLDLFREKEANQNQNIATLDASYKQSGSLIPHHYLGIYAGNGIFVDINGNVGVDIIRLLGFDKARSYKITRSRKGSIEGLAEVSRTGKTTIIDDGIWGSSKIEVTEEENGYSIKASRFFDPDKITFDSDKVEYKPSGFFSNFRIASIEQSGNIVRGSSGGRMELADENRLLLNGTHEIVREGNKLILKSRTTPILSMVKSGDRYVFFRSDSYGSWIEKLPDRIRISDNGSITEFSYEMEIPPPKETKPPAERESQRERRSKTGKEKVEKKAYYARQRAN